MLIVRAKRLLVAALFGGCLLVPAHARAAPLLFESFDNVANLTPANDWFLLNASQNPGSTGWFQGNAGVFTAQDGTDGYIAANFNNATPGGNVNNWLVMPTLTLNNGDTLSFLTRTEDAFFNDGLQVLLASATPGTINDFDIALLTLGGGGPLTYPSSWTQYTLTIAGLAGPTDTRLAFRYFVNDTNQNGDYIGIDDVTVTPVPEPATLTLLGLGLAGLGARRYRQSQAGA